MAAGPNEESHEERPLPPEELSVRARVELRWQHVLDQWKRGWHEESTVESLETYLESRRKLTFEDKCLDPRYDWERDWVAASILHDCNQDFVRNRRAFNDDLKRLWFEWHERSITHGGQVSLEALRGMILINGASILACLTILSGQVTQPNPSALLAAKIMVFCNVLSLLMMAGGQVICFHQLFEVIGKVRGALVGNTRHRKLYAVSRYLKRHLDPALVWGNALIYGSIFVFAISSFLCALILVFDGAAR
ncbi:hypothetical protein CN138_29890 [Sinorhizobium meliloti]|uniref:hypothetical protein n=1 Tax=Rhizobium meliloti TaxID=382 RepID=UPI000FD4F2E3|nr:hypothetical protein [Sinorhizobium meliloti]RVK16201.1 hypothetical protein CN164_04355 [Sinorhizobium meliloti]RVL44649.1 hypothetical protein CN145_30245 [Sinorhizobium meliloti]RVL64921.1 hypothetical protein CN138_29890 [Sinorhizobium meliloti]RVP50987.1 hypothetical protein CN076_32915 [Sinorhizobium meliloti]RVP83261.1 hypothetical protein CN073_31980 [Sinorhizobium meliloti]